METFVIDGLWRCLAAGDIPIGRHVTPWLALGKRQGTGAAEGIGGVDVLPVGLLIGHGRKLSKSRAYH